MLDLLADRLAAVDAPRRGRRGPTASLTHSSRTWTASSRVGTSTSACGFGHLRPRLEPFEDRDAEGGRLAGARLRLAHQVDALQRAGNQPGLDGRGLEILGLVQARRA